MKKIILLLVVMVVVAFAGWQEQSCWQQTGPTTWVPQMGLRAANCRKFLDFNLNGDSCNKARWEIPFKDTLSLAQWLNWSIEGNRILDLVRKPGTFVGMGPILCVSSNCSLIVSFEGFGDLKRVAGCPPETDSVIEKYYALTTGTISHPGLIDPALWVSATALNNYSYVVPTSCGIAGGVSRQIWEKIEVSNCNPACEYEDRGGATIVLTLGVMKPWIEPSTGLYMATGNPPPIQP